MRTRSTPRRDRADTSCRCARSASAATSCSRSPPPSASSPHSTAPGTGRPRRRDGPAIGEVPNTMEDFFSGIGRAFSNDGGITGWDAFADRRHADRRPRDRHRAVARADAGPGAAAPRAGARPLDVDGHLRGDRGEALRRARRQRAPRAAPRTDDRARLRRCARGERDDARGGPAPPARRATDTASSHRRRRRPTPTAPRRRLAAASPLSSARRRRRAGGPAGPAGSRRSARSARRSPCPPARPRGRRSAAGS